MQTGASSLLQLGYPGPGAGDTWSWAHGGSGDMQGLLPSWQHRLRGAQGALVQLASSPPKQGTILLPVGSLDLEIL